LGVVLCAVPLLADVMTGLSKVSQLTLDRERAFKRWRDLSPNSHKAIKLNLEVRRLTEELLQIERQSNGTI
jgi:hypothetical protein